ncbi:MAG: hypothetical protein IJ048_07125 [Clostridia bacterium]|nr:hypothetical protein [Clostridia bacterium]
MNQLQMETIESLRAEGLTYDKIASAMSMSLSAIKMYFSRKKAKIPRCDQCRCRLVAKSKKARFCSDSCRFKWYQSHLDTSSNPEKYIHNCLTCGKVFFAVKPASFCSRPCYYQSRRKVAVDHE